MGCYETREKNQEQAEVWRNPDNSVADQPLFGDRDIAEVCKIICENQDPQSSGNRSEPTIGIDDLQAALDLDAPPTSLQTDFMSPSKNKVSVTRLLLLALLVCKGSYSQKAQTFWLTIQARDDEDVFRQDKDLHMAIRDLIELAVFELQKCHTKLTQNTVL